MDLKQAVLKVADELLGEIAGAKAVISASQGIPSERRKYKGMITIAKAGFTPQDIGRFAAMNGRLLDGAPRIPSNLVRASGLDTPSFAYVPLFNLNFKELANEIADEIDADRDEVEKILRRRFPEGAVDIPLYHAYEFYVPEKQYAQFMK